MAVELRKIDTEQRNPRTMHIDTLSTLEMVKLINDEDHRVAEAVARVLPEIARAVDIIYEQLRQGGYSTAARVPPGGWGYWTRWNARPPTG